MTRRDNLNTVWDQISWKIRRPYNCQTSFVCAGLHFQHLQLIFKQEKALGLMCNFLTEFLFGLIELLTGTSYSIRWGCTSLVSSEKCNLFSEWQIWVGLIQGPQQCKDAVERISCPLGPVSPHLINVKPSGKCHLIAIARLTFRMETCRLFQGFITRVYIRKGPCGWRWTVGLERLKSRTSLFNLPSHLLFFVFGFWYLPSSSSSYYYYYGQSHHLIYPPASPKHVAKFASFRRPVTTQGRNNLQLIQLAYRW